MTSAYDDFVSVLDAEPMLYEAGLFFFQNLVTFTQKIPLNDSSKGEVEIKEVVPKLLADMPQVEIKNEHEEFVGYVVELLTQMGLLWSKRSPGGVLFDGGAEGARQMRPQTRRWNGGSSDDDAFLPCAVLRKIGDGRLLGGVLFINAGTAAVAVFRRY